MHKPCHLWPNLLQNQMVARKVGWLEFNVPCQHKCGYMSYRINGRRWFSSAEKSLSLVGRKKICGHTSTYREHASRWRHHCVCSRTANSCDVSFACELRSPLHQWRLSASSGPTTKLADRLTSSPISLPSVCQLCSSGSDLLRPFIPFRLS